MTDAVMTDVQTPDQMRRDRAARASDAVRRSLKKRYAAEARFRAYGIGAVAIAMALAMASRPE